MAQSTLSIAYQNVRGLRTKLADFKLSVQAYQYDISFITETWLRDAISDHELVDTNEFTVFRRDRETSSSLKKDGGGAMIILKSKHDAILLPRFNSEAEDLWVLVDFKSIKLYLCCVYIPPHDDSAVVSFIDKLNLNRSMIGDNLLLIVGDFNMPSINWVHHDVDPYLIPTNVDSKCSSICDTFSFAELMQCNCVHNSSGRILDLVLCNKSRIYNLIYAPLLVRTVITL